MTVVPPPTAPKLVGNLLDLALGPREHLTILWSLHDFVRRPGLGERVLQLLQRVGANGASLPSQNHEADRTIESRNLSVGKRASDLLGQS